MPILTALAPWEPTPWTTPAWPPAARVAAQPPPSPFAAGASSRDSRAGAVAAQGLGCAAVPLARHLPGDALLLPARSWHSSDTQLLTASALGLPWRWVRGCHPSSRTQTLGSPGSPRTAAAPLRHRSRLSILSPPPLSPSTLTAGAFARLLLLSRSVCQTHRLLLLGAAPFLPGALLGSRDKQSSAFAGQSPQGLAHGPRGLSFSVERKGCSLISLLVLIRF